METAVFFSGKSKSARLQQAKAFIEQMNADENIARFVSFAVGHKDFKFVVETNSENEATIKLQVGREVLENGYLVENEKGDTSEYEYITSIEENASEYNPRAGSHIAWAILAMNGYSTYRMLLTNIGFDIFNIDEIADLICNDSVPVDCNYDELEIWHPDSPRYSKYIVGGMSVKTRIYDYDFSEEEQNAICWDYLNWDLDEVRAAVKEFAKANKLEHILERFVLVTYKGKFWHFVPNCCLANFNHDRDYNEVYVFAKPTQEDIEGVKILLDFVKEYGKEAFYSVMFSEEEK